MTTESQPSQPEHSSAGSEAVPHQSGRPPAGPADPRAGLRASDADREAVAERLREAAGEGRLDLAELEERLEATYLAKTYGELSPITADLPGPHQRQPPVLDAPLPGPPAATGAPLLIKGGMHGAERVGRWQVPAKIIAKGGLGGVKLDFTRTQLPLGHTEIEVHGDMAGITIVVPEGWRVESGGVDPSMGGLRDRTSKDAPEGATHAPPTIYLTGSCGLGGTTVRHPNVWERRRLRDNPA
ncbi:DUF1707 domain-containing protein [Streptomyces sp. DSM 44915]|uniref:DUF1707 domain-containing protein n=1 Tax=Streptomyces chisholmiae TaxID=3075540 RepID=A0ABU2JJT5_9ACTN|nr:DUF1707 domain-containing protein [Streptomyces sp. DSM 44915]MDT0265247.1 DUF1707 domain-containing protein [Streptomyces sp. DSM 44915]